MCLLCLRACLNDHAARQWVSKLEGQMAWSFRDNVKFVFLLNLPMTEKRAHLILFPLDCCPQG